MMTLSNARNALLWAWLCIALTWLLNLFSHELPTAVHQPGHKGNANATNKILTFVPVPERACLSLKVLPQNYPDPTVSKKCAKRQKKKNNESESPKHILAAHTVALFVFQSGHEAFNTTLRFGAWVAVKIFLDPQSMESPSKSFFEWKC